MSRALSVTQLLNKKRKLLPFDGEYEASFGKPEHMGSWLIWGGSGSGKTTFVMKLSKYLTKFGRVAYNSMEEGDSESIKIAFLRVGMEAVKRKLILLDNEKMPELKVRLRKRKAPKIVILDSVQYSGMTYAEYRALREEFPDVLFVIISHAEGKEPAGKVAKAIRYDSFVKILVRGYKAFPASRYGGGEPFVIWQEGASKFYSKEIVAQ